MSAELLFPIFTLFFISDTFFCFNVLDSKSYIAFSSERVNITVVPFCSNICCNFNVIFKFISASAIPLLETAPSDLLLHVQHLVLLLFLI